MRRYLTLFFVLALCLRALVPAGYMLAASAEADGQLVLVVCTGHGLQKVDADGRSIPDKPAKADQSICPFAASSPVAHTDGIIYSVVQNPHFAEFSSGFAEVVRAARHELPGPARGPPVTQS